MSKYTSLLLVLTHEGFAVPRWFVLCTCDRLVSVQAVALDVVLYSWARHLTLTVLLSTQVYQYKCVLVNFILRANPARNLQAFHPGGSRKYCSTSRHPTETRINSFAHRVFSNTSSSKNYHLLIHCTLATFHRSGKN